ncbi:P-loop containing nucleoside triphosphate hydrolase (plasmid) [Nostoc flagelliforme CCNUN1]|uniref:P-loop containing nucleoside triphosphate hydrolase n=2 Tax=Nostoc flagelliforme TaxID=1306274 RepID=A0A2K8T9W2_9NOSO|nr:P-loop containing nucleoside triphosphate hydrolase [Nostoc flagelliforme CCNUN1]
MDMTRFSITKNQKTPEQWSALAFKATTENNIQWNIALGLIVAAVTASATSPLTGALIAGWTIYSSFKKAQCIQRNQAAIREYGCIAHILDGDDFRGYVQQVGQESVNKELQFASSQEYEFSNAAIDYIEEVAQLNESPQPLIPYISTPNQLQYSLPINTNTSSSVHNPTHIIDIVREIASPIRNCIIFGIGGSGKGMLVANALRRIKAENPNRKIFYIDPKNEASEYGYTEGVVDVVRRKRCKNESPENICKWMDEVLDGTKEEIGYIEWANNQEECLLVIDEGSTLGDAAKKCRNERIGTLILHISSLGGSSKENVWLLAQSPYVGPLGLNLSATSQITAVAIISDKNTNVLKQWKKSPILEMIDLEKINTLIKASPCNRAVFFGGNSTWGAMPELPNYSALDRDNDKPTGDSLSTQERQQLRTFTAIQRSPSQQMIDFLERTRHSTLEDFIVKELGQNDRADELKTAIVTLIRQTDHQGLIYKFKIDV